MRLVLVNSFRTSGVTSSSLFLISTFLSHNGLISTPLENISPLASSTSLKKLSTPLHK